MHSWSLHALVKEFSSETKRIRGQRFEGLAVQGQIPGLDTERMERSGDLRGDCHDDPFDRQTGQIEQRRQRLQGCLQPSDRNDDRGF